MEFGCHLPIFGPAATRAGLLTFAREMERLGYDSLWASDHIVIPHAISSGLRIPQLLVDDAG